METPNLDKSMQPINHFVKSFVPHQLCNKSVSDIHSYVTVIATRQQNRFQTRIGTTVRIRIWNKRTYELGTAGTGFGSRRKTRRQVTGSAQQQTQPTYISNHSRRI